MYYTHFSRGWRLCKFALWTLMLFLSLLVSFTSCYCYLGRLWSGKELQTLQHQCSVHQPWHKKVTSTINVSRDFWMRQNLCFLGKREEVVLASLDGVWRGYRHFCLPSFTSFWAPWFKLWELSWDWAADRPRLRQNEHFTFNQPDKEGTVLSKERHDGKECHRRRMPSYNTRRALSTTADDSFPKRLWLGISRQCVEPTLANCSRAF